MEKNKNNLLLEETLRRERSLVPLGLIVIAVIMIFMALLTVLYWFASWVNRPFPRTIPLDPRAATAFSLPDIISSVFMVGGACGLLRRRSGGFLLTLLAMGMSLTSGLFLLGLTGTAFLNILGPTLFFALFTVGYLWSKRSLFFGTEE